MIVFVTFSDTPCNWIVPVLVVSVYVVVISNVYCKLSKSNVLVIVIQSLLLTSKKYGT